MMYSVLPDDPAGGDAQNTADNIQHDWDMLSDKTEAEWDII